MSKLLKAMIPGTFDPIHSGHIDIIKRASKIFNEIYVVISKNIYKKNVSNAKERMFYIKKNIKKMHLKNVHIMINDGLTIDFAKKHHISVIIRGIRNKKDLFYETNVAQTNFALNNKIETFFMLSKPSLTNVSSTSIKYLNDIKKYKKKYARISRS